MNTKQNADTSQPWWRYRIMWLVVMGPALVVVASIATMVLAIHGGDRPLPSEDDARAGPLAPAHQARNHAATPDAH